ncbi:MAG: DNA cytosine methyltransferase [Candidatus Methanoperedens sp.]|nr:DNA cytosine methyltransferase [Candidatus Methanoperedens sp.]
MIKEIPTAIDLFCGCGGFSLGFINAGWHVVAALDASSDALHTYYHNLCDENTVLVGDLSRAEYDKIESSRREWRMFDTGGYDACRQHGFGPGHRRATQYHEYQRFKFRGMLPNEEEKNYQAVDVLFYKKAQDITGYDILDAVQKATGNDEQIGVVMGGPPCQGFSRMNTKKPKLDTRNFLIFEFGRLVQEINPKTFVMENVPDIQKFKLPDGRNLIKTFLEFMNTQDWDIYFDVQALYLDGNMDPEGECTIVPQIEKQAQKTLMCY